MESKKYLDIDHSKELKKLYDDILILQNRLKALSIDYNNYISPNCFFSAQAERMNELSISLSYRFKCAGFHIKLFCSEIDKLNENLKYTEAPKMVIASLKKSELVFIFDSTIYHICSIFDYIGSLFHYIHNYGDQQYKTWNRIAGTSRNNTGSTYELISKIHKEFADNLIGFRSKLIHDTTIFGPSTLIETYSAKEELIEFKLISSPKMLRYFAELKKLSQTHEISLKYSIFYIMHKTIGYTNEILFELKKYVELNKRNSKLAMTVLYNGEYVSGSKYLWHEHLIIR